MLENLLSKSQYSEIKPLVAKADQAVKKHSSAKFALGAAAFLPMLFTQIVGQTALSISGQYSISPIYLITKSWRHFDRLLETSIPTLAARSCRPIGSTLLFQEFFQSYLLKDVLSSVLGKFSPKLGALPKSTEGKVMRVVLSSIFLTASKGVIDNLNHFSEEAIFARSVNYFVLALFSGTLREYTGNSLAPMALNTLAELL